MGGYVVPHREPRTGPVPTGSKKLKLGTISFDLISGHPGRFVRVPVLLHSSNASQKISPLVTTTCTGVINKNICVQFNYQNKLSRKDMAISLSLSLTSSSSKP